MSVTKKSRAWVINLDRYPDNWTQMQQEWSSLFDLQRVSATDGQARGMSGRIACKHSHISLLLRLSQEDAPYHIVMEDDIFRLPDWEKHWPAIQTFLDSGRDDWDFISMDPVLGFDKPWLRPFTNELFEVQKFRATGFIIYNASFLKKHTSELLVCWRLQTSVDMTYPHNPSFRKLTPRFLLTRQRSDKCSTTSGSAVTDYYAKYYEDSAAHLAAARESVA
jgi:hypothetical protein